MKEFKKGFGGPLRKLKGDQKKNCSNTSALPKQITEIKKIQDDRRFERTIVRIARGFGCSSPNF